MIYHGLWIICRSCLFPVRLPYEPQRTFGPDLSAKKQSIVLACPACGHVRRYRQSALRTVGFRIPDPFRVKKAVLYAVDVGCTSPHCPNKARIYAVAAITVSVASLLEVWKHWVIHLRCQGHAFSPRSRTTWGIYSIGPS